MSYYHFHKEQEKPVLNIMEASKLFGVSYQVFKRAVDAGEIPYKKLGGRYVFSREALLNLLNGNEGK